MQPLVAKRKRKENFDLTKDYFIFGLYPSESVIFPSAHPPKFDASRRSFYLQKQTIQQIVSHIYIPDHQSTTQVFACTTFNDGVGQFCFLNENSIPQNEKDLYFKELIEVKSIEISELITINDNKLSTFSLKNEAMTLNQNQYQYACKLINCIKTQKYGTFDISKAFKSPSDLNIIPAVISHISLNNRIDGPYLIVVKNEQMIDELFELFNNWTSLRTLVMIGNESEINAMQNFIIPSSLGNLESYKFHVVLTTKSIFKKYNAFFHSMTWIIFLIMSKQFKHVELFRSSCHFGVNLIGLTKNDFN